jgi:DNA-binding transcriptional LysR family regulator
VLTPLCGKRYKDKLKTLEDLKRVPFIDMTYDPEWSIWLRAVGMGDFKPKRVLTFDSTMIAVEGAMEGAGVAVGPPQLFREELAEGRLFQPFPQIVDFRQRRGGSSVRPLRRAAQDARLRGLAGLRS